MNLVAVPATDFSAVQLATILSDCFEGYHIPVHLSPALFAQRFIAEGLSLADSRVWKGDTAPEAIALVARRGTSARLAAFAIRPAYRGQGLGKKLMLPLVAELMAEGVQQLWLEVTSDNLHGQALYHSLGFSIERLLCGYQCVETSAPAHSVLSEVDPLDVVRKAVGECSSKLPWQIDPLTAVSLPAKAFEYRKHAYAIVSGWQDKPLLRFIYVEPEYRHKGFACELLRALSPHFPALCTPVSVPESFTPLFQRAGYNTLAISQYEMRASLKAVSPPFSPP
ncbi:GNAT family N-acetyltransferase [Vagococcus sp. WN89Y]|uniref:GNAT family N-acetyltransferase n=1 Tax=Vagococcus sp. WN89Y TaxID=3457258 RepID=UPI003FCCC8E9